MDVSRDSALIAMIQIDISGCSDQQFIHRAVHDLSTKDMPERMKDSRNFNSDGENQCLIQTLVENKLRIEQIEYEVKAEENKRSKPRERCD